MKAFIPLLTLPLLFATGAVFAAEPPKTTKPAATPAMEDCKKMMENCKGMMDMQHGQMMDHSKMGSDAMSGHHPMTDDGFAALDQNKDGALSKAEFAKHPMAAHFGMLDTDRDGQLSQAEFAKSKDM